jgi:hypothetical protein
MVVVVLSLALAALLALHPVVVVVALEPALHQVLALLEKLSSRYSQLNWRS